MNLRRFYRRFLASQSKNIRNVCFFLGLVCFLLYAKMKRQNLIDVLGAQNDSSQRIMLLWNHNPNAVFKSHYKLDEPVPCENYNCYLTANRDYLATADAVLLGGYPKKINEKDLPPLIRQPRQVYIFMSMEAPDKGNVEGYAAKKFNSNFFNWTATYRRDSTVHTPYARFVKRPENKRKTLNDIKAMISRKTKASVWWSSRCNMTAERAGRFEVIKNLAQYTPIDIYGECGPLKCGNLTSHSGCSYMLKDLYKFYMAFENGVCYEYITEKFWGRIEHFIVPVVLRSGHYFDMGPTGPVFIAVDDFKSVKALGEHLNMLQGSASEYLKYVSWYMDYEVQGVNGMCEICKALSSPKLRASTTQVSNLSHWLLTEPTGKPACHPGYALKLSKM